MKVSIDGAELSFIPESSYDRVALKQFMKSVDSNENKLVDADLDGVNLDTLVLSPFCLGDASHCPLCGKANPDTR